LQTILKTITVTVREDIHNAITRVMIHSRATS